MYKFKLIKKVSLFSLLCFFLSGCVESKDDNTWLVGTSADNPPFEYVHNKEIQGFDIDLINLIAKKLNKNIELRNMDFQGLLASLNSNAVDVVIAGMTATEKRAEIVDFSIAYLETKVVVVSKSANSIDSLEKLNNKLTGSQTGTTWAMIAKKLGNIHSFNNKSLASNLILIEELKSDRIDAVFVEESQAKKFLELYPELSYFVLEGQGSNFSIAMPKGFKYKDEINRIIKEFQKDGTIKNLAKKWKFYGC